MAAAAVSTPAPRPPAERALELASTPAEVKAIYDMAEAYRVYAKNAADQNLAATVKLRASAKGGGMLKADPELGKGKSGRLPDLFPELTKLSRETLSSRWQRIAALDELGTLAAYLASVDGEGEITMAGLFHYAKTGALNSSDSPEWYTPSRYLNAARDVMGGIDLDPASCAEANDVVRARQFFGAEHDGLSQPWHGRVFLNPPYGKSAPKGNALFIPKLIEEYEAGRVTAAVVLTSAHGTETDWFALLWNHQLCFTDHRVPYWNEAGIGAPTFGSVFTYLGPERERFADRFAEFGPIVHRWQR